MRRALPLLAVLALGACSHAPHVARYEPPAQANFVNAPEQTANDEPVAEFWRGFEDDELSSLVQRALKANTDIRTAAANLEESRAIGRLADADLWPTVNLGASAARIRAKDSNGVPKTNNAYSLGLDVLWEVDVFGRLSDA